MENSLAKPQGDIKQKNLLSQKRGPSGQCGSSLANRRTGSNYTGGDYYSSGGNGYGGRGRNSGPAYQKHPSGGYGAGPAYGGPGNYDPYGFPAASYYPPVANAYDPYGPPAYDAYSAAPYGAGYGNAPVGVFYIL